MSLFDADHDSCKDRLAPAARGGRLRRDRRGLAAVEFALVVPLMLVLFFGALEFSSGVAVDRKVTLVARTLSDLTTQLKEDRLTTMS
jgi:Flp pilus assembly protein TadG